MKKYYLMGVEKKNIEAMLYLCNFYYYKHEHEKLFKYCTMIIKNVSILNISIYYNINNWYGLSYFNNYKGLAYFYLGYYYEIHEKYEEMKIFYTTSIDLNMTCAMYNLGYYYYLIKDYESMKKYLLMACNNNHINAMFVLGYYYSMIEIDYNKMKKYYMMAGKLRCVQSLYNLGYYYQYIEKDYNKMKKCYLIANEYETNYKANIHMARHYRDIKQKYDKMIKYNLIAMIQNYKDSVKEFSENYKYVINYDFVDNELVKILENNDIEYYLYMLVIDNRDKLPKTVKYLEENYENF